MPTRTFLFAPLMYVTVTVTGVNYRGRITRAIWQKGGEVYDVQYVDDRGEFKRGEFYEDELVGRADPAITKET